MRYNIPDIDVADLNIAESAEIGAESSVQVSYDEWLPFGEINMSAPASGTFAEERGFSVPSAGRDLVMLADNGVRSAGALAITIPVTFDDNTPGTATATFAAPDFAQDTSNNFPQGLAVDVIGNGTGNASKKIKRVLTTGVTITNGAAGNRFIIAALPDADTYFKVGCTKDKSPTLPIGKSIAIPCGFDGARWIKKGRSEAGKLDVTSSIRSYGDGLLRLNGHRVSVLIETKKEDRVLTERIAIGGWRPTVNPKKPDGDTEADATASGMFETFAVFV